MKLLKQVGMVMGMLVFMVGGGFGATWDNAGSGIDIHCSPAVGDLDLQHSGSETVVGFTEPVSGNRVLRCFSSTGAGIWRYPATGSLAEIPDYPVIANIKDGPGWEGPEVLFVVSGNNNVYCLDYKGNLHWTHPCISNSLREGLAVADINGDGNPEILTGGNDGAGSIYPDRAQDGQSGIIKVSQSNGNVELLVSPVNTTIGSHDRLSFVTGANFSNVKFQLDSGDSVLGNASITANEIFVASGAVINADKKGYLTSNGTGKGTNGVNGAGAGGAGYGNTGGNGESGISGGVAYGETDSLNPASLGSGGGFGDNYTVAPGGSGGGRLKLSANVITIDGIVSANGEAGYKYSSGYAGGAGSGGSIFISCDSLKGEGSIQAKGNDGANNTQADGGGSAGGRIALIRNVETFTGNVLVTHGIGPDNATDGGDGRICRGELGSGGIQGTMSKPLVFKLYQNYPNPFRNKTTIQYSLPKTSKVSLKLYDLTGRCVKTLVDGERLPGYYKETLESKNYPTGIYFAKFNAGEYKETKKLILMK